MKIGILVAGILPDTLTDRFARYGDMYEELLDGRGFTFRHYECHAGQLPASPDEADAWLVTGSKSGAYEDLPWINALKAKLRTFAESNRPIVGVCFGHQILANLMGGRVEKFAGGWARGRTAYKTAQGTCLHAIAWHQDQVLALPDGARRLASSEFCENAMMLVGGHILGIQPHPEFDASTVKAILAADPAMPADPGARAAATASGPLAREAMAQMIDTFLRAQQRDPDAVYRQVMGALTSAKAA